MGKPVDVSATDFEAEVLQVEGTPVLVDFWSETCGHCLALNPQFEQAAEETGDRVKFAIVTFSDNKDIFKQYSVRATPRCIAIRSLPRTNRSADSAATAPSPAATTC